MRTFYLLIIGFVLFASCKKEESALPTTPEETTTEKQRFVSKTWKATAYFRNGVQVQDPIVATIRATFELSGSYTLVVGTFTETGDWAFNVSENRIIFNGGTVDEKTWNITELSNNILKTSHVENGTPYAVHWVPL